MFIMQINHKIRFNTNQVGYFSTDVLNEANEVNKAVFHILNLFDCSVKLTVTLRDRSIPLKDIFGKYLTPVGTGSGPFYILDLERIPFTYAYTWVGECDEPIRSLISMDGYTLRAEADQRIGRIISQYTWRHILGRAVHIELYSPVMNLTAYFSSSKVYDVYDVKLLFHDRYGRPDKEKLVDMNNIDLGTALKIESYVQELYDSSLKMEKHPSKVA